MIKFPRHLFPCGEGCHIMKRFLPSIILLLLLCACSRPIYVPVESKHIETNADSLQRMVERMLTMTLQDTRTNTVFIKESATYTVNEKGDTTKTVIEREKDSSMEWNHKEAMYLAEIDSLKEKSARVDSVYVEKPVPVEVVKEVNVLKWWQKALMWSGLVMWLFLLWWISRILYRRK